MPMPGPQYFDEDNSAMVHGPAITDLVTGTATTAQIATAVNLILAALRSALIIAQD